MRLLLAGSRAFGAEVFHALQQAGHQVAAVTSPPCAGRDHAAATRPDRLRQAAVTSGVPWLPRIDDAAAAGMDLLVTAHYQAIIAPTVLGAVPLAVGYHPSLLPLHRGPDSIRWTVHDGDRVTGGTVYRLTSELDAGPVLLQQHVLIRPDDSAESLWRRALAPLGVRLLVESVRLITSGEAVFEPQDESLASYESWLGLRR